MKVQTEINFVFPEGNLVVELEYNFELFQKAATDEKIALFVMQDIFKAAEVAAPCKYQSLFSSPDTIRKAKKALSERVQQTK